MVRCCKIRTSHVRKVGSTSSERARHPVVGISELGSARKRNQRWPRRIICQRQILVFGAVHSCRSMASTSASTDVGSNLIAEGMEFDKTDLIATSRILVSKGCRLHSQS